MAPRGCKKYRQLFFGSALGYIYSYTHLDGAVKSKAKSQEREREKEVIRASGNYDKSQTSRINNYGVWGGGGGQEREILGWKLNRLRDNNARVGANPPLAKCRTWPAAKEVYNI